MPKRKPAVIVPPAPTAPKPMAHADSPRVIADSDEYRAEPDWRCATDDWPNTGARCTTCGGAKP